MGGRPSPKELKQPELHEVHWICWRGEKWTRNRRRDVENQGDRWARNRATDGGGDTWERVHIRASFQGVCNFNILLRCLLFLATWFSTSDAPFKVHLFFVTGTTGRNCGKNLSCGQILQMRMWRKSIFPSEPPFPVFIWARQQKWVIHTLVQVPFLLCFALLLLLLLLLLLPSHTSSQHTSPVACFTSCGECSYGGCLISSAYPSPNSRADPSMVLPIRFIQFARYSCGISLS